MAALETPAKVVRYILQYVFGEAENAKYDRPSWEETEAEQSALGMKWAVRFTPRSFTEFVRQVAEQSNADLFQSGGLWVYRWRRARPALATFSLDRNMLDKPQFARVPPRTALAASLKSSWDPNLATNEYRQARVYRSNLTGQLSTAQLGRRVSTDEPITLEQPFVWDTVTADWLARKKMSRVDRQRWAVTVQTDWDALPLEKGDSIVVESPILQPSLGQPRGTFIVLSKRFDPSTDAIVLDAEETETPSLQLLLRWQVRATFVGLALPIDWAVKPRLVLTLNWALLPSVDSPGYVDLWNVALPGEAVTW